MNKALWSLTAVLLLLGAGAWQVAPPAANATPAGQRFDCCLDPSCPPGCCPECPPDCLDSKATAKIKKGEQTECGPLGASCSDPACRAGASKTLVKKPYICPSCPLCPGW